jgi:2,4-dienoyl-CoA reductase-like NADH-dependent reductase (Old Yellow Enzyme family)
MPHLFDPFTLKSVEFRNRIGVSPMCQYSYQDGFSNDWQVVHLASRAVGGAGLVIAEAAAVEARGRITFHDVGIWSDDHIEPLSKVAQAVKKYGAVAGIQIAHAGRKGSSTRPWESDVPVQPDQPEGYRVVGPSPIAFQPQSQVPHELSLEEIQHVVLAFREAASRALQAGFNLLEIHGAHGYLIHSFYSPISNQRTDQYGGSFDNRIRLLLEVVRAVRTVWPEELPLIVRISGKDWMPGGWDLPDSVELARRLKLEGVDLIDCSSGGIDPRQAIPAGAGYQVPISEAVRATGIPTAAVGLITAPMQADEIIRNQRADLVLLGREMLRDPYWALHAAQTLRKQGPVPNQYLRGF